MVILYTYLLALKTVASFLSPRQQLCHEVKPREIVAVEGGGGNENEEIVLNFDFSVLLPWKYFGIFVFHFLGELRMKRINNNHNKP